MFELFKEGFIKTFIRDNRYKVFVEGFKNTMIITVTAAIIGIIIGVFVSLIHSLAENARDKHQTTFGAKCLMIFDKICTIYVAVMRGTPLAIQLMIMTFIIMGGFPNKVIVCCIAFGVNSGAYVSEVIRGGIASVDYGQTEAGRSLGLSQIGTLRLIVLPQAGKNILPALCNEAIAVLKETSICGYIGLNELTRGGDIIRGTTFDALLPLFTVAIIYLVIVMFFTWVMDKIERRLRESDIR